MLESDIWEFIEYFKQQEFDCKCGCNTNNISEKLVRQLNNARFISGYSFKINSACRCENHNVSVGGSLDSSHKKGLAVDIAVVNSDMRYSILSTLIECGFSRIGIYKNFIHVDIDDDKPQDVIWYK